MNKLPMVTLSLILGDVFGVHPDLPNPDEVRDMIAKTPDAPDFTQYFPALPDFGHPLRLASPCIGISGSGQALSRMNVPIVYNNVFDLESRYQHWLMEHMIA